MIYYLKIVLRSFLRHKSSSLINLIGLTAGLTCAFFIYLWVQDEYAIDKFHENDERLYQVMNRQTYAGGQSVTGETPGLLGEALKADFPDIQYAATTTWIYPTLLSHDNTTVREDGYHAGEDFFQIFTYPLLVGNPSTALDEPGSICISRDLATLFFGGVERAMGQTITIGEGQESTVTGVFENVSEQSTSVFDFVRPLQDFLEVATWATQWANSGPPTYVVLQEGIDPEATTEKIAGYVQTKAPESKSELFLKKYSDQYLYGRYTDSVADGGRIEYVRLFTLIAIFILVIACINFMNLSTARASKRAATAACRACAS